MPFSPINYGNILAQGENILSARAQRDPNSLENQLLQEKINQARNPAADNGGIGQYNPRDYTAESWGQFIKSRDPTALKRFQPLRPGENQGVKGMWNVITGEFLPSGTLEGEIDAAQQLKKAERTGTLSADVELGPTIAEQNRQATLGVDLTMQPKIEAAVGAARESVKEKVEKKRLSKAYDTYKVGISSLKTALSKTMTGPLIGRLPAMTGQAQVAQQAKAMMLPILKGIVRGAGEGVFTDQDAAAVLALIPDRVTDEAAMEQIFTNIDAFIESKLQMTPPGNVAQPTGETYEQRRARVLGQ